jgi:hypothetical protein
MSDNSERRPRRASSDVYTEGESDYEAAFDKYDSSDLDGSSVESDDEDDESDPESSIGSESMSDM